MKQRPIDYLFDGMFTLLFGVIGIYWLTIVLKGLWGLVIAGLANPFQGVATLIVIAVILYIKKDSIRGFFKKVKKSKINA